MSGDLKWNKIFGAGLGTVFAILVVQQVSGMVYKTEAPEKMGYFVDAPEEAAGGANGVGPNLNGVVGRAVAGHAGFAYSDAMKGHTAVDATWSLDALDHFITAPARYIPGTKMSFAGLRDTQTRVNLIAYLRSQGSAGFPIPAPDPARQPPVPGAEEAEIAPVEGDAPATAAVAVADTTAVQAAPAAH